MTTHYVKAVAVPWEQKDKIKATSGLQAPVGRAADARSSQTNQNTTFHFKHFLLPGSLIPMNVGLNNDVITHDPPSLLGTARPLGPVYNLV